MPKALKTQVNLSHTFLHLTHTFFISKTFPHKLNVDFKPRINPRYLSLFQSTKPVCGTEDQVWKCCRVPAAATPTSHPQHSYDTHQAMKELHIAQNSMSNAEAEHQKKGDQYARAGKGWGVEPDAPLPLQGSGRQHVKKILVRVLHFSEF